MYETHAKLALMKASLAQKFYGTIGHERKELDFLYYWGDQPQVSLNHNSYCCDLFYGKPIWYEF